MSDGSQTPAPRDAIAESIDSALRDLTLPEVFPDAEIVARLQRSLAAQSASTSSEPEVFAGRYRLERMLGRGGMGIVWLAWDTELGRAVAIKMLHGPADAAGLARMRREARAIAQLTHPNIVSVYDVVLGGDVPFIVMEYVEDGDLRRWLDRTPAPTWIERLVALEQAGLGLEAAHRAGLVHRDFKPANVIIGRGRVRVIDFGLVHTDPLAVTTDDGLSAAAATSFTRTGATVGTPPYMAPEQHACGAVTAAADVFAFACSLHEALYGVRPFPQPGLLDLVDAKRNGPPPAPPSTGTDVPARLYPIIARGLSPDPAARWPTMAAFIDALRRARQRRTWFWPIAASAVLALASWCAVGAAADPCTRDVDAKVARWARERAVVVQQVERAGVSTGLRDAVDETLVAFGDEWSTLAEGACATAPADRDDVLALCLADLGDAASARMTLASSTHAAARRFAHDIDVFPSVDECGPAALEGLQAVAPDPAIRREVAALRVWAEGDAPVRRDDEAEMLARAHATGHHPTVARVHLGLAYRSVSIGDSARALASCERAFDAATAGGSDWLALNAAASCIGACSNLGRVDDAQRWNGHIEALSQRLDVDPVEHLRGRMFLASAVARAGMLDEARRLADDVDRRARRAPAWAITAVNALAEAGMIAIWLDDFALAVDRLELALARADEYFPDDEETMAIVEGRLATAYRYVDRHEDAEALFVRTLAHPLAPVQRLMTVLNYAQMLADQPDRIADAYALLHPMHDEWTAEGRGDSVEAAHVLAALGQLHMKAHREAEARRTLLQARELYGRLLEPGHIHARNVDEWLAKLEAADQQ